MKVTAWIGIIIVVIVVTVLGINLIHFVFPAPTQPSGTATTTANVQPDTPDYFAGSFYRWYIAGREADTHFPYAGDLATTFGPWLTQDFITTFNQQGDELDADPILYAQDDPKTWGPGITSSLVSQTDNASTVRVSVGSGTSLHTYTVQLLKVNGAWRIDSIKGSFQ